MLLSYNLVISRRERASMSSILKALSLSLLMFFSLTVFVPNASAANIVTKKADGSMHVKADAEHLQILNDLMDTDITYKELIERVFPELFANSSPETLKAMDHSISEINGNVIKNDIHPDSGNSTNCYSQRRINNY